MPALELRVHDLREIDNDSDAWFVRRSARNIPRPGSESRATSPASVGPRGAAYLNRWKAANDRSLYTDHVIPGRPRQVEQWKPEWRSTATTRSRRKIRAVGKTAPTSARTSGRSVRTVSRSGSSGAGVGGKSQTRATRRRRRAGLRAGSAGTRLPLDHCTCPRPRWSDAFAGSAGPDSRARRRARRDSCARL